ncbi:MAG: hypothetical protein JWQ90_4699 [Hydrocarboniphaga sp.]|nr:hypothetical protein [Hydrocarboniphaga sp.]
MLDQVFLSVRDTARSVAFYTAALAELLNFIQSNVPAPSPPPAPTTTAPISTAALKALRSRPRWPRSR